MDALLAQDTALPSHQLHFGWSYKRLSKGRFRWWPQMTEGVQEPARVLRAHQAQVLLAAGTPNIDAAPVWRKVS